MRWTAIAATALATIGLLSPAPAGAHMTTRPDPYELGSPGPPRALAAQAQILQPLPAGLPLSFSDALARLLAAGSVSRATQQAGLSAMVAARHSLARLQGTRRAELAAVIGNLTRISTAGLLTPSRLPALVLTLERNRQWWTTGPLLSFEQRVGFPGSLLVWEYYPGQGIEIQWLASFGKANGYFLTGRSEDARLGQILDELVGLAVARAGGIAWEYDFQFDGGSPPWVSSIAEGTAVQALARGAIRLARPAYLDYARQALTIFESPPPVGVRLSTPNGAWYLIYSFAPRQLVLNAFIQSLVGLYDFATLANDQTGRTLFAAGETQARIDVPHYDTGAWSLYDQSAESDLGYHELLGGFLRNLCNRTQNPASSIAATIASTGVRSTGVPATGVPPTGVPPTGVRAAGVPSTGVRAASPVELAPVTGGSQAPPFPAAGTPATPGPTPAPTPVPAPGPQSQPSEPPATNVFCSTAADFAVDLHQPPRLSLRISGRARAGRSAGLRLTLSKISSIALTAVRAGHPTSVVREQLGHGTATIPWTPATGGRYTITAAATDLAGNTARTTLAVSVAARRTPAKHPSGHP